LQNLPFDARHCRDSRNRLSLRSKGLEVSYDDGPALWADKRKMVYQSAQDQIVFIGSSRIKYDLDIQPGKNRRGSTPSNSPV
jgi:hypothetical protein